MKAVTSSPSATDKQPAGRSSCVSTGFILVSYLNGPTRFRMHMSRLFSGCFYLLRSSVSEEAFAARRTLLCQKKIGLLRQKVLDAMRRQYGGCFSMSLRIVCNLSLQVAGAPNPMSDMSGMMNMMKGGSVARYCASKWFDIFVVKLPRKYDFHVAQHGHDGLCFFLLCWVHSRQGKAVRC